MSKQAQCMDCGSQRLLTMTQVDDQGNRTWGAVCEKGHWGATINHLQDFSSNYYGRDVYRERYIPPSTPMSI
eukprot:3878761-Rhodomonas_salina.1